MPEINYDKLSTIISSQFSGLEITIGLFAVTMLLSLPLGLGAAFLSNSKITPLRWLTRGYVFVMRGTPLMLQLFFFYFGLPFIPYVGEYLKMGRFSAACVAFVLNYAAYFCEIFRGGFLAVDRGQNEAAKVLGLTRTQTLFRVILPQMFKVALPSVANETITLVKDTALVTALALADLMNITKKLVISMNSVLPFFVVAVYYLIMIFGLTKLFGFLEKKAAY